MASASDNNDTVVLSDNMDKGIDALAVDVDLIASKNKVIQRHVNHLDDELKREYLLPTVKKETYRSCDACLDAAHKRLRSHDFVRAAENFSEKLFLDLERYRQENFEMKSAIRSKKRAICKAFGVEMDAVEDMFFKRGGRRSLKQDDNEGLKEDASRNEIKEISRENEMLQRKVDLLCKETEWLNKDVEALTNKLGECNRKRLQDKACLDTFVVAKARVLKAKRSHNRVRKELKNLSKANMILREKKKNLLESIEQNTMDLSEDDSEIEKLFRTRKRLFEKWRRSREASINDTRYMTRQILSIEEDFSNNFSIYRRIEVITKAKIGIIAKIDQNIESEKLIPDRLRKNENDGNFRSKAVDEGGEHQQSGEENGESPANISHRLRHQLNSLRLRLEKLKGLHKERNAQNALLATKMLQLNRILDQQSENLLNLQTIRIKASKQKVKLEDEAQVLLKAFRGSSQTRGKKSSSRRKKCAPGLMDDEAISAERDLLYLLATSIMMKSVEDLSLYTTLTMNMKEKFKQSVKTLAEHLNTN